MQGYGASSVTVAESRQQIVCLNLLLHQDRVVPVIGIVAESGGS